MNVISLPLAPGAEIASHIAASVDARGFIQPLVPGDNFAGFTIERREATDDRRGVNVEHEGVTALKVEGLAPNSNGSPVFAISPERFTLKPTGKASRIGVVLKREHDGKALVKFSV